VREFLEWAFVWGDVDPHGGVIFTKRQIWREILGQGLRGGGPGRPPFWRTPEESRKGSAR
jgi:hypothetical protein